MTGGKVRAWEVLLDDAISETIRRNIDNLGFVSDYIRRFPDEAGAIKDGVSNAVNKQNWLNLFELEDLATRTGLVKRGAYFVDIENIPWAKDFTQDFVDQLRALRTEFGDEVGRFDLIEFDFNSSPSAAGAVEYRQLADGSELITLEINRTWLNNFENSTYLDLQNSIRINGESGAFVAENMQDIVNHEFAHLITTKTALNNNAQSLYNNLMGDSDFLNALDDISYYCTTGSGDDAFEGLAEIFTAHKQGEAIPSNLKNFFNQFSPHYQIP